ncbi:MAG TPA: hypothetical protein VGU90_05110 [Terriglobales bacterium]|jgi:hypothetical protein|nr:hypothetical protein [Terriglobales bacterium]
MSTASIGPPAIIERRVRIAGALVCLGLLIQLLTLVRIHPLAFVAFILIGCPLVFAGLVLYLYSIVSYAEHH